MIQNLIGTLVNVADTVMLGICEPDCHVGFISCRTSIRLFFSVCIMEWQQVLRFLCAQYWGKGDKKDS